MRPKHLYQIAFPWRGEMPNGGWLCKELKAGKRAIFIRDYFGTSQLCTTDGVPIEGINHIKWRLNQIERAAGQRLFFDGIFQVEGSEKATHTWLSRGWKSGKEAGQFFVLDCFPLSDWIENLNLESQAARLNGLKHWIDLSAEDDWEWRPGSFGRDEAVPPVVIEVDGWAFDPGDVLGEARRIWATGGNGLMLMDPEAPYRRERNSHWRTVTKDNALQWKNADWPIPYQSWQPE